MKVPAEVKTSTYIIYTHFHTHTHTHTNTNTHTHTHTHTHYLCPYIFTCRYPVVDLIGDDNVVARADVNTVYVS